MCVAEILVKYALEAEMTASEVDMVLNNSDFSSKEAEFINLYVNHIRERASPALSELRTKIQGPLSTESTGVDIIDITGDLWKIWECFVMTPTLIQVKLLSPTGKAYLGTIFASIVREAIGTQDLMRVLTRDHGGFRVPHDFELSRLVVMGLDEECSALLPLLFLHVLDGKLKHITRTIFDRNTDRLQLLENWLEQDVFQKFRNIRQRQLGSALKKTLSHLTLRGYVLKILSHIVEVIETEEQSVLSELETAVREIPDVRPLITAEFLRRAKKLLLHNGTHTSKLMLFLLRTTRSFRIIDPTRGMEAEVTAPIRALLKERSDTPAMLAEGLFGLPNSALTVLHKTLMRQDHLSNEQDKGQERLKLFSLSQKRATPKRDIDYKSALDSVASNSDPVSYLNEFILWRPPAPGVTDANSDSRGPIDPISELVSLYDNKEVILQQFTRLFSNSLIESANTTLSPFMKVDELQILYEQLGNRFGKLPLLKIGIMLDDVRKSEELSKLRRNELTSALVLSRLYWPSDAINPATDEPALSERFAKRNQQYAALFKNSFATDGLELAFTGRGLVEVTLELADRRKSMKVKPHEAEVIYAFDDSEDSNGDTSNDKRPNNVLSITDIVTKTGFEKSQVLEAVQFWVDQWVLAPESGGYRVLETNADVAARKREPAHVVTLGDITADQVSKQPHDQFADMHRFWSYINGMLTNLGALPIDKIHSFLLMFVPSEDPYVKSKPELETYLLAMVDEGKLLTDDGKYSLP